MSNDGEIFWVLNPKGPYLSLEKDKKRHLRNKRACEIRKFHVTVVYVYSNNPQKHSHHVHLKACLHGGGGLEVGEVTRLGG